MSVVGGGEGLAVKYSMYHYSLTTYGFFLPKRSHVQEFKGAIWKPHEILNTFLQWIFPVWVSCYATSNSHGVDIFCGRVYELFLSTLKQPCRERDHAFDSLLHLTLQWESVSVGQTSPHGLTGCSGRVTHHSANGAGAANGTQPVGKSGSVEGGVSVLLEWACLMRAKKNAHRQELYNRERREGWRGEKSGRAKQGGGRYFSIACLQLPSSVEVFSSTAFERRQTKVSLKRKKEVESCVFHCLALKQIPCSFPKTWLLTDRRLLHHDIACVCF